MATRNCLRDPIRLEEIRRLQPLDPDRRDILGRLADLAAELSDAPVALVTIVEGERQVFAAHHGLPQGLAAAGQTPIDYSLCQYAVVSGKPLVVESLAGSAMLEHHPAREAMGVAAYAGVPLFLASGQALGALCVIDFVRRNWTDDLLAQLASLADVAAEQFDLQDRERRKARAEL